MPVDMQRRKRKHPLSVLTGAVLLWGTKNCFWLLPTKQDAAASLQKCINLTAAKSVWTSVAEIGRNNHVYFAFSATYINYILDENTDIFRKSQGPDTL